MRRDVTDRDQFNDTKPDGKSQVIVFYLGLLLETSSIKFAVTRPQREVYDSPVFGNRNVRMRNLETRAETMGEKLGGGYYISKPL